MNSGLLFFLPAFGLHRGGPSSSRFHCWCGVSFLSAAIAPMLKKDVQRRWHQNSLCMFYSVHLVLLPSVLARPWPAAAVPSSFAWRDSCGHHVLPAPPGNPQGSWSSHRRVVTIRALPAAAAKSGSETAGTGSFWTTRPALGFSRGPGGNLLEAWRSRLASMRHLLFACWLCGSLNASPVCLLCSGSHNSLGQAVGC